MKLIPRVGDYFALDIGSTSVRAVQLGGSEGAWTLSHYSVGAVDLKVSGSDAPEDRRKLAEIITNVINQSGIRTKDVILGVPSNKTFTTVIEVPDMPINELASTIKYQADQYIPMSADEAKVDWALLGKSAKDPAKNEVLVTSVANTFIEARLDMIEHIGLNVIAMEPDPIALMRSLSVPGSMDAQLIVEMGEMSSDLVILYGGTPRLIRSVPVGVQTLVRSVASNLSVQQEQAQQFITKFGVQQDKLEGQVFRAATTTLDSLTSEIDKSIKFFQARYSDQVIKSIIVSNYAATTPGLIDHLATKSGLQVAAGNPWQRVRVSSADQAQLQPLSAQFAVAVGLAERGAE